jgi:hypothetical protein
MFGSLAAITSVFFHSLKQSPGFLPVIRPRPMSPTNLPINIKLIVVWSNFQKSRRHEQECREQVRARVNKNKNTYPCPISSSVYPSVSFLVWATSLCVVFSWNPLQEFFTEYFRWGASFVKIVIVTGMLSLLAQMMFCPYFPHFLTHLC